MVRLRVDGRTRDVRPEGVTRQLEVRPGYGAVDLVGVHQSAHLVAPARLSTALRNLAARVVLSELLLKLGRLIGFDLEDAVQAELAEQRDGLGLSVQGVGDYDRRDNEVRNSLP